MFACEGCVRAVTAVSDTITQKKYIIMIQKSDRLQYICVNKIQHSLVLPVYTQSPILAWLLLALISVDFTPVPLETRAAGASEATGVVIATAATQTWL